MNITRSIIFISLCFIGCQSTTEKTESSHFPEISCIALCDKHEPIHYELTRKHEGKIYYDKTITKTKDSVIVSFDFIETCCLDFNGHWEIKDEVLILTYSQKDKSNLGCDCKCDYRMKYIFNPNQQFWKRVRIKKGL